MNGVLKNLKKNKIIYLIILLFLFAKLLTISNYKLVWWDSAVYIGMGKYIYSFDKAGLWEESRPIVWPLILGFLWKIGLNAVTIGRVLEIIFGSLCILLTYLIGKRLFNEKIALLASIFLALSPTFFFFNGVMLTEIVSTFFSLLGIYFFIDKKYLPSGVFLGMAFMTRFLQLFVFFAVVLISLMQFNKKNIQNLIKIVLGFIIAIMPFLIFNQILYNNAFFPFSQQIFLSKNSGWSNYHPINYYFMELFKDNILYLSVVFGISLLFKNKDTNKKLIVIAFLIFFVFFNSIKQKEMRFLIVLFPYMYLLVSFSIINILDNFKNNLVNRVILIFVILSFIFSIISIPQQYNDEFSKNNQYAELQDKFEKIAQGKVWVSNPIIPVFSEMKVGKLIYYPFFNEEKKKELIEDTEKADFIFIDSCDLACKSFDKECENNKNELITYFKQHLKTIYSSKMNSGMRVSSDIASEASFASHTNSLTTHCGQFIFKNKTIF